MEDCLHGYYTNSCRYSSSSSSGVRRLVVSDHLLPTTQRLRGASLPASSAHRAAAQQCKPAPQVAYTQSFQYGQAMAH
ncbi:hypothetical protein TRIUR3_19646 [Triticum urartu]|uniref:Uncharacterized protein n=1 Tax=Triticum urartu TaxID=4572 RepID=M8AUC0_TRIUA|nr:hypothetical protein TRIUR3_19646 [Triticum urartu]